MGFYIDSHAKNDKRKYIRKRGILCRCQEHGGLLKELICIVNALERNTDAAEGQRTPKQMRKKIFSELA